MFNTCENKISNFARGGRKLKIISCFILNYFQVFATVILGIIPEDDLQGDYNFKYTTNDFPISQPALTWYYSKNPIAN